MLGVGLEYRPSEIDACSSLPSSTILAICSPNHLYVNTAVIFPAKKKNKTIKFNINYIIIRW